ncbi:MAG: hypothetical protein WC091_15480 [Sulfuricellaceae bacterium]
MSAITFDTLKFANRLKEAGVPPAQAEAEAVALSEVFDVNLRELATREDLRHDLTELENRLENRILSKLYQAMLLQTFALAALFGGLKLFGY